MAFRLNKSVRTAKQTIKKASQDAALTAVEPAVNIMCSPASLKNVKRALFVQPHPDDNQIGAGGTMAMLVASGAEVWELTVTDDRFADPKYIGVENETLTTRQSEALAAQKLLGVKNAGFLGFADKTRASIDEISQAILPVIRRIQPDIVITVDPYLPNECHSDHIKVGQAVKFACMDSECNFYPEFENGGLRSDAWRVKAIGFYYTDRANTVVDISGFEKLKMDSIKCHVSQAEQQLVAVVNLQQKLFARNTPYTAAERLCLLRYMHMHCFNLPV